MQYLGINFGGVWSVWSWFSLFGFLGFFCLRNLCWFLKVQWQQPQHSLWVGFIVSCFRSRNLNAGLQLSSVTRQLHIATITIGKLESKLKMLIILPKMERLAAMQASLQMFVILSSKFYRLCCETLKN